MFGGGLPFGQGEKPRSGRGLLRQRREFLVRQPGDAAGGRGDRTGGELVQDRLDRGDQDAGFQAGAVALDQLDRGGLSGQHRLAEALGNNDAEGGAAGPGFAADVRGRDPFDGDVHDFE